MNITQGLGVYVVAVTSAQQGKRASLYNCEEPFKT